MDKIGERLARDQADIIALRSEASQLQERAKRMLQEADEIERVMQLSRLQRS